MSYTYHGKAETVCREPSLARQSEAAATDINVIMKQFEKTGLLPQKVQEAIFTDVSEIGDFRTALAVVAAAQEGFMQIPAEIRRQFDNDAAAFVDFCSDPGNREQLVRLGLVEKAQEAAPVAPQPPAAA